jgi:hypothetical protein
MKLEKTFIAYISPSLPLFSQQLNAYRFQCPYCQSSGKSSRGKVLAPSDAKGYLYPIGNGWNFKCHKCGEHQSFEKFLEQQFPLLHFEYVRLRDQLGITGFQTNCPSLETLLRKRGMLSSQPPEFRPERFLQHLQRPAVPPGAPCAPTAPKVTKLPPMRSPQQQAGHHSRLNHLVKQRQQRKRREPGDSWLI